MCLLRFMNLTIHVIHVFQAWVKCSIVGYVGIDKDEIRNLQSYITDLDEIRDIFVSNDDLQEFKSSNEPILTFIISFMKKQNTLKVYYFDEFNLKSH